MSSQPFKMPPLEWVRAFEAAARCGSFTAAAAETGLTQSAISQRIGHLERLLGTKLFYRGARSIELTVEGEAWLPHVVRVAFGNLRQSSEALFGPMRGRMIFSASQSMINLWLLPRLKRLQKIAGGQLSVQSLVLGSHDAPTDDVIGIRYGAGAWPHVYKMQLFKEQIAPLASPVLAENGGHWESGRASLAQGRVQTGQIGRAVLEPQQHRCPMCDLTRSCRPLGLRKQVPGWFLARYLFVPGILQPGV